MFEINNSIDETKTFIRSVLTEKAVMYYDRSDRDDIDGFIDEKDLRLCLDWQSQNRDSLPIEEVDKLDEDTCLEIKAINEEKISIPLTPVDVYGYVYLRDYDSNLLQKISIDEWQKHYPSEAYRYTYSKDELYKMASELGFEKSNSENVTTVELADYIVQKEKVTHDWFVNNTSCQHDWFVGEIMAVCDKCSATQYNPNNEIRETCTDEEWKEVWNNGYNKLQKKSQQKVYMVVVLRQSDIIYQSVCKTEDIANYKAIQAIIDEINSYRINRDDLATDIEKKDRQFLTNLSCIQGEMDEFDHVKVYNHWKNIKETDKGNHDENSWLYKLGNKYADNIFNKISWHVMETQTCDNKDMNKDVSE